MDEADIKPEQADAMPGLEPTAPTADAPVITKGERPRYKSYSKLLDVLLEINSSRYTPATKRFDLSSPSFVPSSLPPVVVEDPVTLPPPTKSLQSLQATVAYTHRNLPDPSVLPADLQADANGWPGYLTPEHEETYTNTLDEHLTSESRLLSGSEVKPVSLKPTKVTLTERDFALQNPVSVHNWLRKHQPQVFDGKDKDSDKGGKSPPPSRKKKGTKQEPTDTVDEDGDADSVVFGSAKAKKKRDDDAYRPKGGHQRPQKRKREKEDGEGKVGKKSRKSNGADDES
ncbi:hypothetical protein FH972_022458 [Carpinus fangiana]|uniref:INO80 complex subunit 3-like middle region domain-containing protein n=1 Tax=Carpinus fangiana TaxID=176857 RepID=A0A5N6KSM6_9ROSI|nr:hypothetical protein FH972_022458 [Carpinus fangiana]